LPRLKCAIRTFRLSLLGELTRHTLSKHPPPTNPAVADGADPALLRACRAVMGPLARLAVARGLRFAELDELLRGAFVSAAREAHPEMPANRGVSRVSAATGLNRREVTRLMTVSAPEPAKRSLATELFTRWLSDPKLRRKGEPLHVLPRQGKAPSFESLAQSVTKDVHPRTLLEEVCRLGLARLDEKKDQVVLLRETFVPTDDEQRMLGFLGSNVGDHLSAAVANVMGHTPRHHEQAMFASELSAQSLERLRPAVAAHWQVAMRELAPLIQQMIDEDEAKDRPRNQRLRIGMYAYSGGVTVVPAQPAAKRAAAKKPPAGRRRKE